MPPRPANTGRSSRGQRGKLAAVKRCETTPLPPNGNAGDQIRYLEQWAIDNPGQTPRFDLYISNQDMISPSFQDLIDDAGRDVAITVIEIRPA